MSAYTGSRSRAVQRLVRDINEGRALPRPQDSVWITDDAGDKGRGTYHRTWNVARETECGIVTYSELICDGPDKYSAGYHHCHKGTDIAVQGLNPETFKPCRYCWKDALKAGAAR